MGIFSELKQRNVFKVGLVYLVVAWALIQMADLMAPQMNLPEWTARMITFVVMLGFPVALVMAWALELTPEGVKKASGNNLPIYAFAAVLVAAVLVWFVQKQQPEKGSEPFSKESNQVVTDGSEKRDLTPVRPSVAVLPFVNMSSDPDNEYFSDGISEELLNLLVKIEGLRVPSRTSSFAFKGQNTDIREIARQLEVNHVLEGSVRKSDNQVRITAQLIDVSTDTHVWSETYDRELESIFAIQDEIAGHIVEALQLALAPTRSDNKPTENMQAYNLYLQGIYQFRRRDDFLRDAETYLRQAVEADPQFADAWAALALTYVVQPNYLGVTLAHIEPLATEAADRAEALNQNMIEPLLVMGNLAGKHGEIGKSLEFYQAAISRQPNNALARGWLGIGLLEGGYIQEAKIQLDAARELDPVSGLIAGWLAAAHLMSGNEDTALKLAERAIELGRWQGFFTLWEYYLPRGEFDELRSRLDIVPEGGGRQLYSELLKAKEDPSQIQSVLESVQEFFEEDARRAIFYRLAVYSTLAQPGDMAEALVEIAPFDSTAITHLWGPSQRESRNHPAIKQYVRDHGLWDLWQSRGWPDLCRPVGDDDFECD
ncbi:MAG: adenylate cyclase [Rhodothermales bacterium]|jgi:adenylate cyclase